MIIITTSLSSELRRALDVVDPAQADEPGEPLPWTMLQGLAELVGADGACYVEQDPYEERMLAGQDTQPNPVSEELEEWYWTLFLGLHRLLQPPALR